MRSSSRMCAGASRTGWWCAHRTRCQIMPGRGRGRSMGSWEMTALTRGFFSFPPQDPTDGQKKELLKGVEAYEDDKGHQQYRITKVEVRRATRGVQAPRSCLSFRPDFAGPLRSHLHRSLAFLLAKISRGKAAPWLVSTCPPGGLCSAWPARLGGQGGAGGALLPPGSPGKRGAAARRPALRAV